MKKFIGKTPIERGIQRRTKRTGTYKQLNSKKEAHLYIPEELLDYLETKVDNIKNNSPTVRQASAKRMLNLIEILEKQPDKPITYLQLASALAFEHGLTKEKLSPEVNAINNLQQALKKEGSHNINGSVIHLLKAITVNAPSKVLKKLESGKITTTLDLSSKLNIPRPFINQSLLLLETMGLAIRLPQESHGHGGQQYRWVLESHQFKKHTLPKQNVSFKIFMSLLSGPKGAIDFISPKSGITWSGKKPRGFAPNPTVTKALNLLRDAGLVTRTKNAQKVRYSLTAKGKLLAKKQSNSTFLIPELRKTLLGLTRRFKTGPYERQTKSKRTKSDLIQKFIEIRMYLEAQNIKTFKRNQRASLAKQHGQTINFMTSVRTLNWVPWSNLTNRALNEVYLPMLDQTSPRTSEWLRRRLKKERNFSADPNKHSSRPKLITDEIREFTARTKLTNRNYDQMLTVTKETFNSRPTSYETISSRLAKETNIPYNKAHAFAQFVFYRWEELV